MKILSVQMHWCQGEQFFINNISPFFQTKIKISLVKDFPHMSLCNHSIQIRRHKKNANLKS